MGLSRTAKIMSLSVIIVCFVLLIAGVIVISLSATVSEAESISQFALGLLLGAVHSILKIIMMEKSLTKIADTGDFEDSQDLTNKKHIENIGRLAFFGRYVITAAVLVVGALVPFFGIFGTIAGIVSLRFAAYLTVAIENKMK